MNPTLHRVALWLATMLALGAEPIRFTSAEATVFHGEKEDFLKVIDGVSLGPSGWSPFPEVRKPQAIIARCESPVDADELQVDLFFLAGRAINALAEFSLSYTTDAEPSLEGTWKTLDVTRFQAEVGTLRRTQEQRLRLDFFQVPHSEQLTDNVYHIEVKVPEKRVTGLRLDAYPVPVQGSTEPGLSYWGPYDFTLTEFRASILIRETTNIALYKPTLSSHDVFYDVNGYLQEPRNLTDGMPATMAHPHNPKLGNSFFFEIDLGREAQLDHINLRNRYDYGTDRMSQLELRLGQDLATIEPSPNWHGQSRADGSHPEPGAIDTIFASHGKGTFAGRYLRISSNSPIPYSPQLAEVEVYESRTATLVEARADGQDLPIHDKLIIPPGSLRLALKWEIPQPGMPSKTAIRWRLCGAQEEWTESANLSIEMACPPPGAYQFEVQALHSDNLWDSTIASRTIVVKQHWWQNLWIQCAAITAVVALAIASGMLWSRRRAAQQLQRLRAESALAAERARIARDLHDEIGANLTHISILSTLAAQSDSTTEGNQHHLEVAQCARETIRAFDEILWSINPKDDTLRSLCHYICRRAEDMLSPSGIHCRFQGHDPLPDLPLPPHLRHELLLAVKETLHNILKHANAQNALITFGFDAHHVLHISLQDDGQGFDLSPIPSHRQTRRSMGLEDLQIRLKNLGGECRIDSELGKGTCITFRLPLSP